MPAQPFDVDLGGGGENVHAFAWADESSLRAAARDDFAALLVPDTRKRVFALTFNILRTARSPSPLFDYPKLVDLFATELIPTQAALDARNPTIFSPARLDVLGPRLGSAAATLGMTALSGTSLKAIVGSDQRSAGVCPVKVKRAMAGTGRRD